MFGGDRSLARPAIAQGKRRAEVVPERDASQSEDQLGFLRPRGLVTANDDWAALLSNSAASSIMAGA